MDISAISTLEQALGTIPRIPIVREPTPVRRLSGAFTDQEVWLKDDGATHPLYGGNKPRKLEYLIAHAKEKGRALLTFGFETSNHGVATAIHCHENGVACELVLVRGPDLSKASQAARDK